MVSPEIYIQLTVYRLSRLHLGIHTHTHAHTAQRGQGSRLLTHIASVPEELASGTMW